MKRGEIWWARLAPPIGRRPVVLLTRDSAIAARPVVSVAQLTSTIRGIPVEVRLGPEDGLDRPCVANLDTINTIAKSRLERFVCALSPKKIAEVNVAIRIALGLGLGPIAPV